MFPIKSIMTSNVRSVAHDLPILEAVKILVDEKHSGLPVVDEENNLVGVLSEADCLKLLTQGHLAEGAKVEDFMTRQTISFTEEDSAVEVCDLFQEKNIRRVPIVRDGKLIGVVSRHDIIRLILKLQRKG